MFSRGEVYANKNGLAKGSISEILKDRANETALNPKHDGKQRGLASMVNRFFDKKQNQEWQLKLDEM